MGTMREERNDENGRREGRKLIDSKLPFEFKLKVSRRGMGLQRSN